MSLENVAVGGSGRLNLMCRSLTRMAILGVSLSLKDMLDSTLSLMNRRGDYLLAVGSPFGVLSPTHFFNRFNCGMHMLMLINNGRCYIHKLELERQQLRQQWRRMPQQKRLLTKEIKRVASKAKTYKRKKTKKIVFSL